VDPFGQIVSASRHCWDRRDPIRLDRCKAGWRRSNADDEYDRYR